MQIKRPVSMKCRSLWARRNRGTTIVEVMIGFTLLSIIIGSLSGLIAVSRNMMMQSVDLLQEEEALYAEIYKTNAADSALQKEGSLAFYPLGNTPTLGMEKIDTDLKAYCLSGAQLLTDMPSDAKILQMQLYFLK